MYSEQQTPEWKERYKIRSGVEATMSEGKRYGLGKLRVRKLPRVHLAVACKVIACNIRRLSRAVVRKAASDDAPPSLAEVIPAFG